MKTTKTMLITTAISGVLAMGAAGLATAGAHEGGAAAKEKCYGVAKAGQNDCAANGHACQGQSKTDSDPSEWKYVAKDSCAGMGGSTSPGEPS